MQRGDRRNVPIAVIAFAVWTGFGLVESAKAYVANQMSGAPRAWWFVLVQNMPWWYTWLLLTPIIIWLAKRAEFGSRTWKRSLLIHTVGSVVISLLHLAIEGTIFFNTRPAGMPGAPATATEQILQFFHGYLMTNLLTYWGVVGAYVAWIYNHRWRDSALQAAQLDAQRAQLELGLAQSRLHALRMELNPHFLFNSLNAISGLVRKQDNASAVEMIARLGGLLRTTLDQELAPAISVAEEVALLEQYLDIERVRFGRRLTVQVDVALDAADAMVPTFLLQPLVENAIKHGIGMRLGDARIDVCIWLDDDRLRIEVRDSGVGFAENTATAGRPEGTGLANTRARLVAMFGHAATVELGNVSAGGASVQLSMPFRTCYGERA